MLPCQESDKEQVDTQGKSGVAAGVTQITGLIPIEYLFRLGDLCCQLRKTKKWEQEYYLYFSGSHNCDDNHIYLFTYYLIYQIIHLL